MGRQWKGAPTPTLGFPHLGSAQLWEAGTAGCTPPPLLPLNLREGGQMNPHPRLPLSSGLLRCGSHHGWVHSPSPCGALPLTCRVGGQCTLSSGSPQQGRPQLGRSLELGLRYPPQVRGNDSQGKGLCTQPARWERNTHVAGLPSAGQTTPQRAVPISISLACCCRDEDILLLADSRGLGACDGQPVRHSFCSAGLNCSQQCQVGREVCGRASRLLARASFCLTSPAKQ